MGACFWTNLLNVREQCDDLAPGNDADFLIALDGGTTRAWQDGTWRESTRYTPPALPLTYAGSASVPLFLDSAHIDSAVASNYPGAGGTTGGGLDVTDDVELTSGARTTSAINATAYTTGAGERSVSVWLEASQTGKYSGLGATFVHAPGLYAPDAYTSPSSSLRARIGPDVLTATGEFTATNLETTATIYADVGGIELVMVSGESIALDNQYAGTTSSPASDALSVAADGTAAQFRPLYITAVSGSAISAGTVNFQFDVDVTITIQPLRKVVARLRNVVRFSAEQMEGMEPFGHPPRSGGEPVGFQIPILDSEGERFVLETIGIAIESGGCLVGDLVSPDAPTVVLATVKLANGGGID